MSSIWDSRPGGPYRFVSRDLSEQERLQGVITMFQACVDHDEYPPLTPWLREALLFLERSQ